MGNERLTSSPTNVPTVDESAQSDPMVSPDRDVSYRMSAKSDAMLVFLDSYMPPYEVHLMDGTVVVVPYKELDVKLAELRETRKERRKLLRVKA